MQITEIFDSSYALVPARRELADLVRKALSQEGFSSIVVYKAKEDPRQIFMLAAIDGAWEVHHTFAEPGKPFVGGQILASNKSANPKFIGTALNLYQNKLDKASPIRVAAFPEMWTTYEKVIKQFTDSSRYTVGSIDDIVRDGQILKSQEIHPTNKFESLKNKKVPL